VDNPANIKQYPDIVGQAPKYTFNPTKANELLDSAGWTQRDAKGIRMKNGRSLKITWLTTTKSYRIQIAAIQQQMLKAVGIDSTPNPIPADQLFADPPDGPLYSGNYGDYGVAVYANIGSSDEPFGIAAYDSSQIPTAANGYSGGNSLFWSNAESDNLLRHADTGFGHSAERTKAFLQEQVIFMRELPSLPLFALPTIYMVDARLQNFEASAGGLLLNMQNWYLPKS
jgi:peptide/nickel transport system substrate-binding protein